MDFFDSRYFSINKKLLRFVGLWPFQNQLEKFLTKLVFGVLWMFFSTPQILNIIVYAGVNINRLIQSTGTALYIVMVGLKMVMAFITENKFQNMYEHIAQNWNMIADEEDVRILLKNSEFGRFLTIGYLSYMFPALVAFITMPMLPLLVDKINPLNESRPLIFILEGEYLVDRYVHYKKIYAFESFTCITTVFVFCAADSAYAVSVQQFVGLMEIIKMRLSTTKNEIKPLELSSIQEAEVAHNSIIQTIQFHQKAINFANVLESTYTITYLIVVGLNGAIISLNSAVIVMNFTRPMEVFRFGLPYVGLLVHLLFLGWTGQQIIDASENLRIYTYNTNWYTYSIKTQKILQFMVMRCMIPCQLTAGGICVLNIENFGSILKTSLSYITVFVSML